MRLIGGDGMPIQVLLVEDSPGDVRLTQEAFRDANMSTNLHVASDGMEATAFLSKPVQFDAFEGLVKSIHDFWLIRAKLPQQRQSG